MVIDALTWTELDELLCESGVVLVDSIDHVLHVVLQHISGLEGLCSSPRVVLVRGITRVFNDEYARDQFDIFG